MFITLGLELLLGLKMTWMSLSFLLPYTDDWIFSWGHQFIYLSYGLAHYNRWDSSD